MAPNGEKEIRPTMNRFKCLWGAAQLAVVMAVILAACSGTPVPVDGRTAAQVMSVIDGDTIEVSTGGQTYRLRYIGMDAPEWDEPWGSEATAANAQLVAGRTVYLERDVSETDRYDRLLRYVYLADGTFVNAELVRLGWATAKAYPPDTKHQGVLVAREEEARQAQRGMWAASPAEAFPPVQPARTQPARVRAM